MKHGVICPKLTAGDIEPPAGMSTAAGLDIHTVDNRNVIGRIASDERMGGDFPEIGRQSAAGGAGVASLVFDTLRAVDICFAP